MVWWAELSHGSLHMTTYRYPSLFATILLFAGCDASDGERPQPQPTFGEGLAAIEEPYQAVYYETPIELRGVVTGPDGAPLAGATVSAQGLTTTTLPDGTFTLSGLTRRTSFATFEAEGHRQESVAVWLHQPLAEDTLDVGTVSLAADTEDVARFLFTGDVSLGRRFLSSEPPIDRVPPDDPDALITVSDAARTTGPILAGMRPYLQAADFASINLETVVTDEPDTPFEQKPYVFFTLPGSLDALTAAGVDYAALANNHMYDYLEKGVVDTLEHLTARDLPHSGAGATPDAAFAPYRTTVRGADYSMISVCSIDGSQYPILFVADEEKGGAAYAWDSDRFSAVLAAERAAGRVPVVNIHTGSEYTELPVESSHGRMLFAAEAGAALVIAHHPHVPQGLQWHGGSLIAHSLGNFIFDQERLETVLGLLVRVDMRGDAVAGARAIPVYLENFVPRAIAGPLADVFLRRIAQASAAYGTPTALHNGQLWILPPDAEADVVRRTEVAEVSVGASGRGYLDLRQLARSDESLAAISAPGLRGRLGRDQLLFGDMEDVEVDVDVHETAKWYYTGGSSRPCLHETHRGTVALCSHRKSTSQSPSVINFRNRVRTLGNATDTPNKDLTLLGWLQGDNAGRTSIEVEYFAPLGSATFGGETALDTVVGDRAWSPVWHDLSMPPDDPETPESRSANARALRIFVEHHAPASGDEGILRLDDFAVVTWLEETAFEDERTFDAPHPHDFVRFEGAPGQHEITLVFEQFAPPGD